MSHARAAVPVMVLALAWQGGCRRITIEGEDDSKRVREGDAIPVLSQVPFDARVMFSLDLKRLRSQSDWGMLHSALTKDLNQAMGQFTTGGGFDPIKEVDRIVVAVPGERQGDDRFAVFADINQVDEGRVTRWIQEQTGTARATFVRDRHTNRMIIGNGAWAEPMAGLAHSPRLPRSVANNPEMRRLCARAGRDHTLWFAAIVPTNVRRNLMEGARFPAAASIMRVSGFVDVGGGLHAEVVAELSNTADAVDLARQLSAYLNQAKRHPETLVLGLAPYLEALGVTAHDARVHASLDLSGVQLGECIERIEALAHAAWTK